ncbi:hypothetical protein D3C79_706170 [compost metagenome]
MPQQPTETGCNLAPKRPNSVLQSPWVEGLAVFSVQWANRYQGSACSPSTALTSGAGKVSAGRESSHSWGNSTWKSPRAAPSAFTYSSR